VLNLLLDPQEERGLAYLFISHDLAVVKCMSGEVLVMREGEVVERGAPEAIYRDPQHEYTRETSRRCPARPGRPYRPPRPISAARTCRD